MSIVLTLQLAFAMITDPPDDPQYNHFVMDVLLTALFIGTIMMQIGILIYHWKLTHSNSKKDGGAACINSSGMNATKSSTQVAPMPKKREKLHVLLGGKEKDITRESNDDKESLFK